MKLTTWVSIYPACRWDYKLKRFERNKLYRSLISSQLQNYKLKRFEFLDYWIGLDINSVDDRIQKGNYLKILKFVNCSVCKREMR